FVIKGNAMTGLQQGPTGATTCISTSPCWATFAGKSNVTAVDRSTGIGYTLDSSVIGNQQYFQVDVTDRMEPGSSASSTPDSYAIRVWTSNGTFYQVGTSAYNDGFGYHAGNQLPLSGG